jgi:hypothetical protein
MYCLKREFAAVSGKVNSSEKASMAPFRIEDCHEFFNKMPETDILSSPVVSRDRLSFGFKDSHMERISLLHEFTKYIMCQRQLLVQIIQCCSRSR